MKKPLFILLIFHLHLSAQNEFITKWTSSDGEIVISLDNDYTYDYNIEWSSVNTISFSGSAINQNADFTITNIPIGDTVIVKIDGDFPSFKMFNSSNVNRSKILDVIQWGEYRVARSF